MRFAGIALVLGLALAPAARAEDLATARLPFDLSVRLGAWSSNRLLDDRTGTLAAGIAAKTTIPLDERISAQFDAYLADQSHTANATVARVRDAYLRYENGPLELRAGYQALAWGRADTLNPTDRLTPRDYTLAVPTDDEQRFGAPGLRSAWYFTANDQLSLHVQQFRASKLPTARLDDRLPVRADRQDRTEWAAKYDRSGGAVDWSLSWFEGYDKQRYLVLQPVFGIGVLPVRDFPRIQVLGADFATDLHGFGLRGEIARTRIADGAPPAFGGKSGGTYGVLGIDRNLADDTNINLQYFFHALDDFRDPATADPALRPMLTEFGLANNQIRAHRHGLTLRYAKQKFDSKLTWEIQAMGYLDMRDYALRPRLNYRLDNHFKLHFGVDLFRGASGSYYDSLRRNSTAFVELRWDY